VQEGADSKTAIGSQQVPPHPAAGRSCPRCCRFLPRALKTRVHGTGLLTAVTAGQPRSLTELLVELMICCGATLAGIKLAGRRAMTIETKWPRAHVRVSRPCR
jgi:site-specific recombinase XerC